MSNITLVAGSGETFIEMPGEWVYRALLEKGDKLEALTEAMRAMERFDFNHIVYPRLLKERAAANIPKELPVEPSFIPSLKPETHTHLFAHIKQKLRRKGFLPYCLSCGEEAPLPEPSNREDLQDKKLP